MDATLPSPCKFNNLIKLHENKNNEDKWDGVRGRNHHHQRGRGEAFEMSMLVRAQSARHSVIRMALMSLLVKKNFLWCPCYPQRVSHYFYVAHEYALSRYKTLLRPWNARNAQVISPELSPPCSSSIFLPLSSTTTFSPSLPQGKQPCCWRYSRRWAYETTFSPFLRRRWGNSEGNTQHGTTANGLA